VKKLCLAALILHLVLIQLTSAQTGQILFERWQNSPFGNLSDLNAVRAFIGAKPADVSQPLTSFTTDEGVSDQYIGRISGWVVAPSTGNYTFWVASDDSSRVWLSSDQTPDNARLICSVDGWTHYHSWDQNPSQKSSPVSLSAGQGYWIEALWQEGGGGDHMALAWQGPGVSRQVIAGTSLSDVNPIAWLARHPVPVSGLGNVNAKAVVLQWQGGEDPPALVDCYEVYFSNDSSLLGQASSWVATVQADEPLQHTLERVAPGTQYAWRVDTVLDNGERAAGAAWTFTTDVESIEVCPPDDPNGCSVGPVVINEIHYDPDVKTDLVEFVELHNVTEQTIDLSGWYFSSGLTHVFDPGASIGPRGFVVITQNAEAFQAKFGMAPAGQFVGKLRNEGEVVALCNAAGDLMDEVDYQLGFPWPMVGEYPGPSIQLVNPGMDNELGGTWRSADPTPGGNNRVLNANAPPILRQVSHRPNQPVGGEPVTVFVKVTDADGVQAVRLAYQIVMPGDYFSVNDARYAKEWIEVPMSDEGIPGDVTPGDNVYSATLPSENHMHRQIIRYRIIAMDRLGLSISAPYADDPQPNFAYFVYDGVPAWTGAIQSGQTPDVTYGTEVMNSLPVYHLLSKKSDVETATWLEKYRGSDYKWKGTLVYDGQVYDHINFRARGGVWRYAMGKNMWKFDFLRGHHFQARDDYGKKYKETWRKMNFSACIQQGSFGQRGEQGMIEALTFKMFNMAGVPAPNTHWLQFRIIDEAYEDGLFNQAHSQVTATGTQYDGDLWGLYMAIEQMDGQFLDEHKLPDGNLYKMEARYGEKNNQGATSVTDNSDIRDFKDTFEANPTMDWWGSSVNLEAYYSHVAVQYACHHGDVTSKNNFMYQSPEPTTNEWGTHSRWWLLPWDTDLTWTTYYGGMSDPFSRAGLLTHPYLKMQMKNRVREVCDLLFNADQMGQLIDEFAAIIDDSNGGPAMVDVDRAMWDTHWVMNTASYLSHTPSAKAGFDRFYLAAQKAGLERSFSGMCQLLKNYVNSRQSHMESLHRDNEIPQTPQIQYVGSSDHAANDLVFATSDFSDPQGANTFSAIQWRLARVNPGSVFEGYYEIDSLWESGSLTPFDSSIQIPASVTKLGGTYRVRCRMMDTSGRWSHWSDPAQFVVASPVTMGIRQNLRITELMYNPADPPEDSPYDNDDFEFIELKNTGDDVIDDLSTVSFSDGIEFSFSDSQVIGLEPGEFVLVVRNLAAFEARYGSSLSDRIAGQYATDVNPQKLSNSGERIRLEDYWQGTLADFEYNDKGRWPATADGDGYSLVPFDQALPGQAEGSFDEGSNWHASQLIHGSPGADD